LDLLGRAKKVWKGLGPPEPPEPQFYRVSCPEGHVLRGQRTEGYQALRCPGCGAGVFILPQSPLPDPPAPASRRRKAPAPAATADDGPIPLTDAPPGTQVGDAPLPDVDIPWEEELAAESEAGAEAEVEAAGPAPEPEAEPAPERPAPARRPPKASRPQAVARPVVATPAPPTSTAPEPPAGMILVPQRRGGASAWRRHRRTLVVLGVLGVVALTVVGQIGRRRREGLPQVAATNLESGTAALESGVFDVAKLKLARAAEALRALKDPDAAEAEQLAGEAAILADLVSTPLEELVERVATGGGPDSFGVHRGRSVVFDAPVAEGGRELDYRIVAGTKRGRIDLAGFKLLEGKPAGEPVAFGARLGDIALGDDGVWRVRLEPDSGVFMSTPSAWKALAGMDWPTENDPAAADPAGAKPAGDDDRGAAP
jgi:hypothetical protein